MQQFQQLEFDSLTRVQEFLGAHTDVVGILSTSDARKQLDGAVTQLHDAITIQLTRDRESRAATALRVQQEDDLRQGHMRPIAEFAREKLKGAPDFTALTPSATRLKGARLVQAARAMAAAAQAHLDGLTAAHFPADVITQLATSANAVQSSLDARVPIDRQASEATKNIKAAIAAGRSAVRLISPIVKRAVRGNTALEESWRGARRVKAKPGPVSGTAPFTPTVTTPVVTPPAATTPSLVVGQIPSATTTHTAAATAQEVPRAA